MIHLPEERLYQVNGGDKEDYDFGYKIGRAAKIICNALQSAWKEVRSWF